MASPLIHHVSVINRNIKQSFQFYRHILGLELLLKTVNQDDNTMYHLFFGDTEGRPGTEFTVFEMKSAKPKQYGTNMIERTIFAVPSIEALQFWAERLNKLGIFSCEIELYNSKPILRFEDFDGVQLGLAVVPYLEDETYYAKTTADIPQSYAIYGIHAIHCRVRYTEASAKAMLDLYNLNVRTRFEDQGYKVTILSDPSARFKQELHLIEDRTRNPEIQGAGSVHHLAMNAKSVDELLRFEQHIVERNYRYSGIKNRDFFKSLYYREPNMLLIEIATEQTNFQKQEADSEHFESFPLFLPPFIEGKREYIERHLT